MWGLLYCTVVYLSCVGTALALACASSSNQLHASSFLEHTTFTVRHCTDDDGPDATKGKLIFVQGKYVMQLAKYIETQLGVPGQYIVVNAKGVSSRDKAINV